MAIGLPWFIADLLGQHLVQHDGGTFGQYAQLWVAPEQGFAFALLANALPGGALAAQDPLFEAFIQYLGVNREMFEQATPAATPAPVAVTPPDLEQYAGRYETPDSTSELRVEDGTLVLIYELHPLPEQVRPALIVDVPPRIPVELIAEDLALVTIGDLPTPITFVRDDAGDIGWVAVSARLVPKVESA